MSGIFARGALPLLGLLLTAPLGPVFAQDSNPPATPETPAQPAPEAQPTPETQQPTPEAPAQPEAAIDPGLVVAKIGERAITRQDVIDSIAGFPEEKKQYALDNLNHLFPQLLERLIFLQLAAEKGRSLGLADNPDVKREIEAAADDAIRRAYFQQEIKARVTEEAVKARYEDLVKVRAFTEIHARHILVASEADAKAIIADLQKGGDFAAIAKEKSTDKGSGAQGGDLGWFTKRTMVKEFADAAFALAPGEMSAAPVKSQFGWHIIKVEEKRERSYDEVKDAVREVLIDETRDAIAKQLRDEAGVEIIDASGGAKPTP